jgi:SAM-dependent methyltransferase
LASRLRGLLEYGSRPTTAHSDFRSEEYLRHNQRRQEHLASLDLPLPGASVLEVGAGLGDHTGFFIDRGCRVTITEGRPENVEQVRRRYPELDVRLLDLDPPPVEPIVVDVVYCYGLLYHLSDPSTALTFLARCTRELLLLETCVSFGDEEEVNPVSELPEVPSQALTGIGCRPTRPWIWARLAESFEHVYATATQPWHEQFPLDWSSPAPDAGLTRAVFVASRRPLDSPSLVDRLPLVQRRH